MKPLVILIFLILTLFNCRDYEAEQKIDPYLKIKLQELQKKNRLDTRLQIIFNSTEPLTETHKIVLNKKGVKVMARLNHLYTAEAVPKGIYYLAKMQCVISIQPSKELQQKLRIQMSKETP